MPRPDAPKPPRGPDDRPDPDARLDEEIGFHLERQIDKHVRAGMPPDRARRAAMVEFGGVEVTKESARDQRRFGWLAGFGRDIRFGLRGLRRAPGFATLAILTLGLGIGASTALFSVVEGVLLRALPYPDADRIVRLYQVSSDGSPNAVARRSANISEPNVIDWRAGTRSFQQVAQMSRTGQVPVSGGSEAVMARWTRVSREFFAVLRVEPAAGRLARPDELGPGRPPTAVISRAFRLRAFGDALPPNATIRIGTDSFGVIGEMPAGFDYPGGTDIWTPTELQAPETARTAHNFQAIARLADGVPLEAAVAELSSLSRRLKTQYGDETWMVDAAAVPLLEQTTAGTRPVLQVLFGAAIVLFVIACANVSNLLLAREASRAQEVAVQVAIGASRWRIARQRLAETLVVSAAGAGLGVIVGQIAIRGLLALDPGTVPRLQEVHLSWTAVAFAGLSALVATLTIGLVTALRGGRRDPRAVLGDAQRGATGGPARERVREILVVSQVAMTLVLLAGAALLGRSFAALVAIDPGYRTEGITALDLVIPRASDPGARQRQWQTQQTFMDRVGALPGVTAIGLTSGLPPGGGSYADGRYVEMTRVDEFQSFADIGRLGAEVKTRMGSAGFRVVGGDYFRVMGIPLVSGRGFEAGDVADAPHVAVVSQSLADDRWPGRDPIGRFVQFGNMDGDLRGFRVVGVVGDVRELSPETTPGPLFYVDYRQRPVQASTASVVVTGGGDIGVAAQRILREINPELPLRVRRVEDAFDAALGGRRFSLLLIMVFGAAALGLAVLGTYGLISYLVAQRTREIGIRLALGASARTVLGLVIGRGARLALAGSVVGLGAALLLSRLVEGMLFGVSPTDPAALAAVVVVTTAAVVAATIGPAIRAMRVSPTETLRAS